MAQIRKMFIQGVRSFNPTEENGGQVIEFFSPMTLIVGENGTGKTTIIESLKYAITGILPPNSKGGNFVNDPKLSTGFEVKAIVKLELIGTNSNRTVVSRKLKAVTKGRAGNVTMSTLEATVSQYVVQRNGTVKRFDMSSKCYDIEELISGLVGVSEPILNHVIFCHQEDSCWPLDEASKVKTKFDAIFNTTMYIKALKSLELKEKSIQSDIRLANNDFHHKREDLQEARRKKARLEELNVQLTSLNDKVTEHEREETEIDQKIQVLDGLRSDFVKKKEFVSKKLGEIEQMEIHIREIQKQIRKPFDGDLPSLLRKIDQFELTLTQKAEALNNAQLEKQEVDEDLKRLRKDNEKFIVRKGIFDKENADNTKRAAEMGRILENLCSYLRNLKENSQEESFSPSLDSVLMSLETDNNSVEPGTAIKALESAISSKESELRNLKVKLDMEAKDIQDELDSLNAAEAGIRSKIQMKEDSAKTNKMKGDTLRRRLSELDSSNDQLALLTQKNERLDENINRLEKSELSKSLEIEIKKLQTDILEEENKMKIFRKQSNLLSADALIIDRINSSTIAKQKKQRECNEILRRVEPELQNLLAPNETAPQQNLNQFVSKKLNKLNKEVKDKTNELTDLGKEVVKLETHINQTAREVDKKLKEISQIRLESERLLQGGSFLEEYANIFRETEEVQADLSQNDAASFLYKQYIRQLNRKPCCPLCKRDFVKEAENEALIKNLTQLMQKMELSKPEQEAKLSSLKTKQEQFMKLKPNWDRKEELEKVEVPELMQKKEEHESKLKELKNKQEELSETLGVLTADKNSAESLHKDSIVFDNTQADLTALEEEIRKSEAARNPEVKKLTVTYAEMETQIQSVESTVAARRHEKEQKELLRNQKLNELTKAKEERNKVVEEKLRITADLQNREAMQQQKKELETEMVFLKTGIQELQKQLPEIRGNTQIKHKKMTELKQKREKLVMEIEKEKNGLISEKDRVSQLHAAIQLFRGEITKFQAEAKEHEASAKALHKSEVKLSELVQEIEVLQEEINAQKLNKNDLENNRLVKVKEQKRDHVIAAIEEDRRAIDDSKVHGVSAQLTEEWKKKQEIQKKVNRSKGSMNEIQESIRVLREELSVPKYSNSEVNHRRSLVKKTVLERAAKDVRLYRIALDTAVMTFHRKKMETINKYLKLYWKKIYKGNDIDYIEIRTENDVAAAERDSVVLDMSKSQRKNYNYRVVMFRRGIELDMRGRCSAGQKVLASIIIRLSLAQTFSTHCGIMTLDEPTTNLDKHNVDSLAEALSELALSMKSQKTFQLVVITHDQDFIDTLLRVDPIDYYYKVSRDIMGFSSIERITK